MYEELVSADENELFENYLSSAKTTGLQDQKLKSPVEWHESICCENVSLRGLVESNKIEQYHTMRGLLGLTYRSYFIEQTSIFIPLIRKVMTSLIVTHFRGKPIKVVSDDGSKLVYKEMENWLQK
jgi:hypothetical protein